jgi:putative ABC transport system permease protein
MRLLALIKRNLTGRAFRSVAIILSVALLVTLLFSATIVVKGVDKSLEKGLGRLGADILVIPKGYEVETKESLLIGKPSPFYMRQGILKQISQIEGIAQASPQLFIVSAPFKCCTLTNALLIAYDPQTDFIVIPWARKNLPRPPGSYELLVGSEVPLRVKAKVRFYGQDFKVIGRLDRTGLGLFDKTIFMPLETAYKMAALSKKKALQKLEIDRDKISTILIRLKPGADLPKVAFTIEKKIPEVQAIISGEISAAVKRQLTAALGSLKFIAILFWVSLFALIAIIFVLTTRERRREFGLLRAMGASRFQLLSIILIEGFSLTGIGGLAGIFIGLVTVIAFKSYFKFAFFLPSFWLAWKELALIGFIYFILAILTGLFASLYAAVSTALMEPYLAIRAGER